MGFYTGKDEPVLGNIYLYDPYFGWLNLTVTLCLGIYYDQLHYDDVIKLTYSLSVSLTATKAVEGGHEHEDLFGCPYQIDI